MQFTQIFKETIYERNARNTLCNSIQLVPKPIGTLMQMRSTWRITQIGLRLISKETMIIEQHYLIQINMYY